MLRSEPRFPDDGVLAGSASNGAALIRWLRSGPPWRGPVVIWVVVFLFVAITTGNLFGSAFMREYRLATKGKQTTGTLSALQLSNHAGCRYTYAVGGVHHSHTEAGCGDGRSVGANLTVTYLPADPGVATTGDAGKQLRRGLLFLLCTPTFLAVSFYAGRRLILRSRTNSVPLPRGRP